MPEIQIKTGQEETKTCVKLVLNIVTQSMLFQCQGQHLAGFFSKFCPSKVVQFSPSQQQLQAGRAHTDNALSAPQKAPAGETLE